MAIDGNGLSTTSAPVHISVAAASGVPYGMTNRLSVAPFLKMPATFSDAVPHLLSGTGVFSDTANRTPAAGLIPYTLNAPMWSDGATESFFMAVPNRGDIITPEQQLRFRPTGPWKFPDGAVFIKNLDLAVDEIHPAAPRRRLETQVLVRDSSGAVYGATYKWRADNSDAEMVTAGTTEEFAITNVRRHPHADLVLRKPGGLFDLPYARRWLRAWHQHPPTEPQFHLPIDGQRG